MIARWRLCWSSNARLDREEALKGRGQGSQQVQLLVMLRIGAVEEALRVHVGAGLVWPEWDCQCRHEFLWEVRAQGQGMVP